MAHEERNARRAEVKATEKQYTRRAGLLGAGGVGLLVSSAAIAPSYAEKLEIASHKIVANDPNADDLTPEERDIRLAVEKRKLEDDSERVERLNRPIDIRTSHGLLGVLGVAGVGFAAVELLKILVAACIRHFQYKKEDNAPNFASLNPAKQREIRENLYILSDAAQLRDPETSQKIDVRTNPALFEFVANHIAAHPETYKTLSDDVASIRNAAAQMR